MAGCIESKIDNRDFIYDGDKSDNLPDFYDYNIFLDLDILDQGATSKCVPYSIYTMLKTTTYKNIDIDNIYERRPNKPEEGMQIRDALKMIKSDLKDPFFQYFRLNSIQHIKASIIANGPCVFALPIRNIYSREFWKGNATTGGHAVCCVGYNKEGFIIQNSWGYNYGDSGKIILPYTEFKYVFEVWGVC